MKQVIVNIPDGKYQFSQELIRSLGYEAYSQDVTITPAMDAAIDHELNQIVEDPSYLLNWNEARKTLKRSGGNA
jgi:hypothetical protein